mmetsp:Transcript_25413/g.65371  ORF Transcript_25413/g.65371 Transcript_25413/m.65371 type:complete len:204 (-) Transcript_25413:590-1201(-)
MPGVTPSITSGFPAFPIPAIRPPRTPISAFTIPTIASTIKALVITRSSAWSAVAVVFCPIPSRSIFPPPNLHSSPYTVKSFSTWITRPVSPSTTRSPAVGPNMLAYCVLSSFMGVPLCADSAGLWPNPRASTRCMISSVLSGTAKPSTKRLPETTRLAPLISTRVTALVSPGSNRTEDPEGIFNRIPMHCLRSNTSALLVSIK